MDYYDVMGFNENNVETSLHTISNILRCIRNDDIKKMEEIIQTCTTINQHHQVYALHYAISQDSSRVVKSLLSLGFINDKKNMNSQTPLQNCVTNCESNLLDIAQQLVTSGVDIDEQDCYGFTALKMCVQRCGENSPRMLVETIKYLIERGADVNASKTELDAVGRELRYHPSCTPDVRCEVRSVQQWCLGRGSHALSMCRNKTVCIILMRAGADINNIYDLQDLFHNGMIQTCLENGLSISKVIDNKTILEHIQQEVDKIKNGNPIFKTLDYAMQLSSNAV